MFWEYRFCWSSQEPSPPLLILGFSPGRALGNPARAHRYQYLVKASIAQSDRPRWVFNVLGSTGFAMILDFGFDGGAENATNMHYILYPELILC